MEYKVILAPEQTVTSFLETIKEDEATTAMIAAPEFVEAYPVLCTTLDLLNNIKKSVDKAIKKVAKDNYMVAGDTHLENETVKVTFVPGSVRRTFNVERFKTDHPDLYEEYLDESLSSDAIRIKLK